MRLQKMLASLVVSLTLVLVPVVTADQTHYSALFDTRENSSIPDFNSHLVKTITKFADDEFGEIDPIVEKSEFVDGVFDTAAKEKSPIPAPVAEPGTLALLGLGMILLARLRRRD